MSIRKISDLPYLTQAQLDPTNSERYEALNNSSLELSYYLSAQAGSDPHTTYVSRQIRFNELNDMLMANILTLPTTFSGTKTFNNGINVYGGAYFNNGISVKNNIALSGNLRFNTYSGNRSGTTAYLNFGTFQLSAQNGVYLRPNAKVDNTVLTDPKSVVNMACLSSYANTYFEQQLAEILGRLNDKIAELDALMRAQGIDYGKIWPVGSLYISNTSNSTCPIANLKTGWTWSKLTGRYLLASGTLNGTSETFAAGANVTAGLPAHTHTYYKSTGSSDAKGDKKAHGSSYTSTKTGAASSSIYGQSATVRPPARAVDVWIRTA